MLESILIELNNWFVRDIHRGTFTVEGGGIDLPLLPGQYFRVVGSIFNDGLHQYPAADMQSETFTGSVWALAVPKAVEKLAEDISAWEEKCGSVASGPYQSESFNGYSYSRATGKSGGALTWQEAFGPQLRNWRKL